MKDLIELNINGFISTQDNIIDEGIKDKIKMEILFIHHNKIITNKWIENMKFLSYLDVSYTQNITDEVLINMPNLTMVYA